MKKIACLCLCLFAGSVNATFFNFEYEYDGVDFTEINGSGSIFGTALSLGDTVNLSITAAGNSYWDVSGAGNLFAGNLGFSELGTRGSSGEYYLYNDGVLKESNSFNVAAQSYFHAGPNYTDFSSISMFDQWDLTLTLNTSNASGNTINGWTNETWNIFGLESFNSVNFVRNIQQVPEPASIALLGLGLAGLGFSRKKKTA